MFKALKVGLTVSAIAAMSVGGAIAASAGNGSDCSAGGTVGPEFCLWQNTNYDGLIWHHSPVDAGPINFATAINDEATSGWNKRAYDSLAWAQAGGGGSAYCFSNGGGRSAGFTVASGWQDSISSARNLSTASYC